MKEAIAAPLPAGPVSVVKWGAIYAAGSVLETATSKAFQATHKRTMDRFAIPMSQVRDSAMLTVDVPYENKISATGMKRGTTVNYYY